MDEFKKFFRKADAKLREQVRCAITAIMENRLEGLDIAPLEGGQKHAFRCRVRNVRILFVRTDHGIILTGIGFRGGVYKKLR